MYATFNDVVKIMAETGELWIRNISPPPQKMLVIDYPAGGGQMRGFNIPRSAAAFNICEHVDAEALRLSHSFREMFNAGVLEVVTRDEAQSELSNDPALAANLADRLRESKNIAAHRASEVKKNQEADAQSRAEAQKSTASSARQIISALDPGLAAALNLVDGNGLPPDPKLTGLNPRLTALEAKLKAGSVPQSLVMAEISSMIGDLGDDELRHLATNPIFPDEVKRWARQRMSFLAKKAASAG